MLSNENHPLADSDFNTLITITTKTTPTTVNSFLSTTTISDANLFHTSLSTAQRETNRTLNKVLLIGCITVGIILIIMIIYGFIKYRNRDEGSYTIDESKNFVFNTQTNDNHNSGCADKIMSSCHYGQILMTTYERNGVDAREWYV